MQTQKIYTQDFAQDVDADTAIPAGLSLILADAARSHLKAGDVETASKCVAEAERLLAFLPGVNLPRRV
ncbi:MAG: hypothetical protein IIC99_10310 [Chloroflexi bacterium]|nr:hypothetical protein [Chloroflexota bacterium]